MAMKPLRIFTPVWGEKHVNWFLRATVQSMSWPKNREAIRRAKWMIYGEEHEFKKIAQALLPIVDTVEVVELPVLPSGAYYPDTKLLLMGLVEAMKRCLRDGSVLLLALPDYIFSEGSLRAILTVAEEDDVCVGMPSVRVIPEVIPTMNAIPCDGAQMVSRAWKHLHDSWSKAEVGTLTNTYEGGVSWYHMTPELISVSHRLPPIFAANLKPSDLEFFTEPDKDGKEPRFDSWDWRWPGERLISQGRQRMLMSSDAAFMMELTEPGKNVPALNEADLSCPDHAHMDLLHHRMNRLYRAIFRKE